MSTATATYSALQGTTSKYKVSDIPVFFSDKPEEPVLRYDRFQIEDVRRQIDDEGFAIVRGLVPENRIERIRSFWIETFSKVKPAGRVTWAPYLGQTNNIGFSSDKFQNLFRAVDFLWNEPIHAETREVCLRVHALRNLVIGEDPYFGIRFIDNRSGIFVTASCYPAGSGHMAEHDDGVSNGKPLVHSLVPVTFQGKDYKEGGMTVLNRKGDYVNVDSLVQPGDTIFYDGFLKHSVQPIVPLPGKNLGRIQFFPIPTVFKNLEDNIHVIAKIPLSKIVQAKWYRAKDLVRVLLGIQQAIR